ncbi:MAG TPA: hypothetical protein VFM36_04915, partial [Thermoanaerobaculia bacterium]|nr:hypothetical protein [Thermoanaerobaculia bacterium]
MPPQDKEIDALFRLPLAEFTSARNALAARFKKEKRPIDAERAKAIPKPPAPAWAVNQLYWENPKAIDKLVAIARRVRQAQTGKIKNVDVRALLDEKKQMTVELMERAAAILREAGHATSPDVMRRVSATLESLAVWGDTEGAPAAGRLTADLEAPGFDALAAVMGGAKIDAANVLPFRAARKPVEDPAAARARAREAVLAAEKVLREARREAAAAEAALTKARARTDAIEK